MRQGVQVVNVQTNFVGSKFVGYYYFNNLNLYLHDQTASFDQDLASVDSVEMLDLSIHHELDFDLIFSVHLQPVFVFAARHAIFDLEYRILTDFA